MAQKFREKILQGTHYFSPKSLSNPPQGSGFSNIAFESDYGMNLLMKMGWSK